MPIGLKTMVTSLLSFAQLSTMNRRTFRKVFNFVWHW